MLWRFYLEVLFGQRCYALRKSMMKRLHSLCTLTETYGRFVDDAMFSLENGNNSNAAKQMATNSYRMHFGCIRVEVKVLFLEVVKGYVIAPFQRGTKSLALQGFERTHKGISELIP